MKKIVLGALGLFLGLSVFSFDAQAAGYIEMGERGRPWAIGYEYETEDTEEQIEEEIRLGDMELIAQLVQAEAGNQSFEGKCLVVDVILNRVESSDFPDTVEEVIFQEGQFSVTENGAWEKAAWNMQESDYAAVQCEMEIHENKSVLYFNNCSQVAGSGEITKVGDHYFR